MTILGLAVDAVATNTVKSQKRRNGASIWGKKKQMNEMLKFYEMKQINEMLQITETSELFQIKEILQIKCCIIDN